jgi:hypothetical protein
LRNPGLTLSSSRSDFRSFAVAGVGGGCAGLFVDIAGKGRDRADVLVEIRRVGEGASTRRSARSGGQDHLTIAAFDVGGKQRRRGGRHRLAEDQLALGEVEPDVLLDEGEVAPR